MCPRVKIHHPPLGAAPTTGLGPSAPNAPRPLPLAFSRPLKPHPRPPRSPSLLPLKPGKRTAPRLPASGHAPWRDPLAGGRARPPSPRAAAAPAATAAAPRPAHLRGRRGPPGPAQAERAPYPEPVGEQRRAGRGGAEAGESPAELPAVP